jgi:hypothetical protein
MCSPVLDQISLFSLPVLTWDITDSWQFTDPYGVVVAEEKEITREWIRECTHTSDECEGFCDTPIGWALVNKHLARAKQDGDNDARTYVE